VVFVADPLWIVVLPQETANPRPVVETHAVHAELEVQIKVLLPYESLVESADLFQKTTPVEWALRIDVVL
jgi:hypothetical protein